MAPNIPGTQDLDRIASLIDHRTEEPEVEYKAWMDLSTPGNKAKLAKHLCALSNYGGGWIVFGVSDDGSHTEPHPGDLAPYSQDIVNGIVNRYLHPAFHCNVHFVTSPKTAKQYPVVQVPPHGAQPICAKSDGPLVDKRRIGVSQGTHYIRVLGPSSVPIDNPELWRKVLHRCVLIERENLLSSIGRAVCVPVKCADSFLTSFVRR
jgi:predicted HTH transcriptional regulator